MGKRIIQQARGRGSLTYRVRRKAFSFKTRYPLNIGGEYEVVKLISSSGHSCPIAKLRNKQGDVFFYLACKNLYEGKKIKIGGEGDGDIARLGDLPNSAIIFNIENKPGDGGKLVKTGGNYATVLGKKGKEVVVLMPSKKQKKFNAQSRATIGRAAGEGRLDKPVLKAGKKYYIMKAKSKLWPRTSAVKMNAIDHPFGSGRGKNPKAKIIKRMSSPGQKVGLRKPKKTGRKKR